MSLAFNSSRIFFKYCTFVLNLLYLFNRSGTVYCMLCVQMVSVCVSGGVTKLTSKPWTSTCSTNTTKQNSETTSRPGSRYKTLFSFRSQNPPGLGFQTNIIRPRRYFLDWFHIWSDTFCVSYCFTLKWRIIKWSLKGNSTLATRLYLGTFSSVLVELGLRSKSDFFYFSTGGTQAHVSLQPLQETVQRYSGTYYFFTLVRPRSVGKGS